MADIDPKSETWGAVKELLAKQRSEAVDQLISGDQCKKQRGKIELIDQLYKLEEDQAMPIPPTQYC